MRLRIIGAIWKKQWKDTLKNKAVFIQFIMLPALGVFMKHMVSVEGLPPNYFITMFAAMYVGMAPMVSMASIIAEEKEKHTLRMLLMSNVKAGEYLFGVGAYVFLLCMAGAAVFAFAGGYTGAGLAQFLGAMAAGVAASLLIGAAIGTWSRNEMAANSLTVPLMLVCSFLPMLSMFNEKIASAARFVYSCQVQTMLKTAGAEGIDPFGAAVIAVNILCAIVIFRFVYRRSRLD